MLEEFFIVARNVRPISAFLSTYLVEEKGFTTREIVGRVIPWWLYAMLFFSVVSPMLVKRLGLLRTILLSSMCDISSGILLAGMGKSVGLTVLTELLGAFRSTAVVADKRYFGGTDHNKTMKYSTLRKITGVVSSFLAQSVYEVSGSSLALLYITLLTQALALLVALQLEPALDPVAEPLTMSGVSAGLLSKIFTYTGAFTIGSSLRIYIDVLLIDRAKRKRGKEGTLESALWIVGLAFRALAKVLVRALGCFSPSIAIAPQARKQKKAKHGYVEGAARIAAVTLAIPLVRGVKTSYLGTEALCWVSWAVQIGGIRILDRTDSLGFSYLSYLVCFLGSSISLYISYNSINVMSQGMIVTIMSYISGASCVVHAGIDFFARRRKLGPENRFIMYSRIGSFLFFCAAVCSVLEYAQNSLLGYIYK